MKETNHHRASSLQASTSISKFSQSPIKLSGTDTHVIPEQWYAYLSFVVDTRMVDPTIELELDFVLKNQYK